MVLTDVNLIRRIGQSLEADSFKVSYDHVFSTGAQVELLATKHRLFAKGQTFYSEAVLLRYTPEASVSELENLLSNGLNHAKRAASTSVPRGYKLAYLMIPCLISEQVPQDVIDYITSVQRERFGVFDFPVVYDLASEKFHYHQQTSRWGSNDFYDLENLALKHIGHIIANPNE